VRGERRELARASDSTTKRSRDGSLAGRATNFNRRPGAPVPKSSPRTGALPCLAAVSLACGLRGGLPRPAPEARWGSRQQATQATASLHTRTRVAIARNQGRSGRL